MDTSLSKQNYIKIDIVKKRTNDIANKPGAPFDLMCPSVFQQQVEWSKLWRLLSRGNNNCSISLRNAAIPYFIGICNSNDILYIPLRSIGKNQIRLAYLFLLEKDKEIIFIREFRKSIIGWKIQCLLAKIEIICQFNFSHLIRMMEENQYRWGLYGTPKLRWQKVKEKNVALIIAYGKSIMYWVWFLNHMIFIKWAKISN